MRIDNGDFSGMMGLPHSHIVVWMIAAVFVVIVIGISVGYSVGRSR